jgi:hypothetical protein
MGGRIEAAYGLPGASTMGMMTTAAHKLTIEIGEMPVSVRTESEEFLHLLEGRYGEFVVPSPVAGCFELEVELVPPGPVSEAEDLNVRREDGRWILERGDFQAELDLEHHRGWVRESANPYSIDAVLRILHSLLLARQGGFLVHAAGAVRHGQAYLFAGVSGAGKTTIARLAPPDVKLLTDEISYVKKRDLGLGTRGAGRGIRDKGYGIRDKAYGTRDTPYATRDAGQCADARDKRNAKQETKNSEYRIPCPEPRISKP